MGLRLTADVIERDCFGIIVGLTVLGFNQGRLLSYSFDFAIRVVNVEFKSSFLFFKYL